MKRSNAMAVTLRIADNPSESTFVASTICWFIIGCQSYRKDTKNARFLTTAGLYGAKSKSGGCGGNASLFLILCNQRIE
jgi:hypothetical protein